MKMFEDFNQFSPGDVVKINKELIYYITHYGWNRNMFDLIGRELEIEEFVKDHIFYTFVTDVYKIKYRTYTYNVPVVCCDPVKIKKRKLNIEEDPFGEEDWGYIQEKFKYGETFVVTDKLKEYIEKYGWDGMVYLIGKTISPINYSKHIELDHGVFGNCYHYEGWVIPEDCVEKKPRKLNLEEDPFGEEDWGYIGENKIEPEYSFIPNEILKKITNGQLINASMEDKLKYLNFVKSHVLNKNISFVGADNDGDKKINGYVVDVIDNFKQGGIAIKLQIEGDEKLHFIHIFKNVYIYDKLPIKKLNLEDDPFGEEDWGYMSESNLNVDSFNIGDIVEIDKDFGSWDDPFGTKVRNMSGGGHGRIINIFKNYLEFQILVSWYNGKSNIYKPAELSLVGKKTSKKLNLEDDPFGEEDWGYVQERIKENVELSYKDFPIDNCYIIMNNEEEFYGLMHIFQKYNFIWLSKTQPEDKIYSNGYKKISIINGEISCNNTYSKIYNYGDVLNMLNKKIKRKLNPEDDPFGEENWGWLEESFSEGEEFLVNNKLREYVEKYNWSQNMLKLIGIFVRPNGFKENYNFKRDGLIVDVYVLKETYEEWFIPFDCLDKRTNKIHKPDIDPFGEENWYD